MKRLVPFVLVLAVALLCVRAAKNDYGLGQGMEIVVNMMRELSEHYVDEVEPQKLVKDATSGLAKNLDPYTSYISEEEMTDFNIATTGKYGGVGSLIRKKGDYIIFAQPYKDSPADRAGIKIGDKIIAINGESAKGWSNEQVSSRLKGDPNTFVEVTIERMVSGEQQTLKLKRERISIPGVPYVGWVAPGIGYIEHQDFTEGCYEDMRRAISSLLSEGELKGLILDYRGNGGGILQEAIKIVGLFTPKGTEVVTTKGRHNSRVFRTEQEPLLPSVPLVVMIDGGSASAAEIVAGALQDLDRAVLIGQRSFGKGLVQSTRYLGYGSFLKLTTAKYYIPSGRCIQAIDYSEHKDRGGREVADSLTSVFYTAAGREVRDGGGITPDIVVEPTYVSRFATTLYALGYVEDYVDEYIKSHPDQKIDVRTFSITDSDYQEFVNFMADKEFEYESASRRMLKAMKEAAEDDNFVELKVEIEHLERNLKDDKLANLETYKEEIKQVINSDIVLRHAYYQGVAEHSMAGDKDVKRAVELLTSADEYNSILSAPKVDNN